jgi:hypothetical protein
MRRLRWWHIPLGIAAVAFAVFWVLVLSWQKTWFSEQPPLMIIPRHGRPVPRRSAGGESLLC